MRTKHRASAAGGRGVPVALAGVFVVVALLLATGAVWGGQPARVALAEVEGPEGAVRVIARVFDAAGTPAAQTPVEFKARTTFGWLSLGERTTDEQGRAWIDLPAGGRVREVRAEVGEERRVAATLRTGGEPPAPRVRPGRDVLRTLSPQPGLISPFLLPEQVALVGSVLGGIWATYGYVGWLLWRIRAER